MWPVASEDTLITHLLAKTWLAVLTLSTVNKRRCLGVEAVETIGVLVDEGVVLRNELPADLGRVHGGVGHDETVDGAASMSFDLENVREREETYRGCRRRGETRRRGRRGHGGESVEVR